MGTKDGASVIGEPVIENPHKVLRMPESILFGGVGDLGVLDNLLADGSEGFVSETSFYLCLPLRPDVGVQDSVLGVLVDLHRDAPHLAVHTIEQREPVPACGTDPNTYIGHPVDQLLRLSLVRDTNFCQPRLGWLNCVHVCLRAS